MSHLSSSTTFLTSKRFKAWMPNSICRRELCTCLQRLSAFKTLRLPVTQLSSVKSRRSFAWVNSWMQVTRAAMNFTTVRAVTWMSLSACAVSQVLLDRAWLEPVGVDAASASSVRATCHNSSSVSLTTTLGSAAPRTSSGLLTIFTDTSSALLSAKVLQCLTHNTAYGTREKRQKKVFIH